MNRDLKLVRSIEKIRSKNNRLWMDILRAALNASPESTKAILRAITENDRAISSLTKEIANG